MLKCTAELYYIHITCWSLTIITCTIHYKLKHMYSVPVYLLEVSRLQSSLQREEMTVHLFSVYVNVTIYLQIAIKQCVVS